MPATPATLPAARLAVLDAIRGGARTVNDLAAHLQVTDNAVRLHLAALERDALISRGVLRSGQVGQPAAGYELTPAGELALSSAYAPALNALVAALGARLEARTARSVFLDAGRRLADQIPSQATGSLNDRVHACASLLESLGGKIDVTSTRGKAMLKGAGCPLASAVRTEPATCYIVEALLKKHAGVNATQHCQHGDHPACHFEITSE